jgi:hypothetical protein
MKLSQEEIEKFKNLKSASENLFSKLANFNAPDTPPKEKEKEDENADPNAPNKFDELMR